MRDTSQPKTSGPFCHTQKKSQPEKSGSFPPDSREDDAWLSKEQMATCERADEADIFPSPIPTQMVSNGEYMPCPQTEDQKRVEARIKQLADAASKKLGISRRKFLAGTGGIAASFVAMNEVFGRFFKVSPEEIFEPAAAAESAAPKDLFVFDDQTHLVRGSKNGGALVGALRAIAQGPTTPGFTSNPFNAPPNVVGLDEFGGAWTPWNPALIGQPLPQDVFDVLHYVKSFFFDSQVTVAVLSNAPGSIFSATGLPPVNITQSEAGEILTAAQTVGVRNFVNQIAGSTRMMAHGILQPGVRGSPNLDFIRFQNDELKPDSWKGYNITNSAKADLDPNSFMKMWRHDDELVAYPMFEIINNNYKLVKKQRPGANCICVHKGLAPGPPLIPERGYPTDLPKAARDWPGLNFITYHSCIQPAFWDYQSLEENAINTGMVKASAPRTASRHQVRHQLDHAVCPARRTPPELLRRAGDDVGLLDNHLPHRDGAHSGSASEIPGRESHRVRVGLDLVWQPTVADRGLVAVRDTQGIPRPVRLPGVNARGEAEDPGAELGAALRIGSRGSSKWR